MTDLLEDVRSFIHPSTIVYTRRGPKEICDVCPGDEVVAQTGTFVAVAVVHRKPYRGLLLDIGGRVRSMSIIASYRPTTPLCRPMS